MGLFDNITSSLLQGAVSAGESAAVGLARKAAPAVYGPLISNGISIGTDLLNGDFSGAAGLILANAFPNATGLGALAAYMLTPNPLFGGISPLEAKQIILGMGSTRYARKNLFLVQVTDLSTRGGGLSLASGDGAGSFNMFVTEAAYTPWTITGEKRRIGSASTDSVHASEPIELRLTTLDDEFGSIKKWFSEKAGQAGGTDGTVGVPIDYLLKIRILHSFVTEASNRRGHYDQMLMRPANIEYDLSRRDSALQELQLTFSEFDTFFPV